MQIIIADNTTLEWRGLITGLSSLPFIVNSFVGPNIATAVLGTVGWRWGCWYDHLTITIPTDSLSRWNVRHSRPTMSFTLGYNSSLDGT